MKITKKRLEQLRLMAVGKGKEESEATDSSFQYAEKVNFWKGYAQAMEDLKEEVEE